MRVEKGESNDTGEGAEKGGKNAKIPLDKQGFHIRVPPPTSGLIRE